VSSMDSLEHADLISSTSDSLRCIIGFHNWMTTDDKIRVNNAIDYHRTSEHVMRSIETCKQHYDDDDNDTSDSLEHRTCSISDSLRINSINISNEEKIDDDELNSNHMDVSLTHFDVQLQVNHGQLEQATRYGVFSSSLCQTNLINKINRFQINHATQTLNMNTDIDMDMNTNMNNDDQQQRQKSNGYSKSNNGDARDESFSRNHRRNNSSDNNNNENNSNHNRNNSNSKR
jgi:hypothetical protein